MLKSNFSWLRFLGKGLLLVFMISLLLSPLPVLAKTEFSDQAESLVVNIFHPDGTTTLVHEYSYGELESLAEIEYYASIDAMPAPVGTKAEGVKIHKLLEHAAQNYNADIVWEPGKKLLFYVTDSPYPYQPNYYTYENLYEEDRYYFPQLVETFDQEYPEDISLEGAVCVAPMLSSSSYSERWATDAELKGGVSMNSEESFRFCMGITTGEAGMISESPELSTTNKFARWVYRVDVGPLDPPAGDTETDPTDHGSGSETAKVAVTGITLEHDVFTLVAGETKKLTGTLSPSNATNTNVAWDSDNPAAATVDSSGLVTAKTAGAARITATTEDGSFTAGCDVKVVAAAVPVTKIKLDPNSCTLKINDTKQLQITLTPTAATDPEILWSSDQAAVATVDTKGLVTAKREGKAVIRAMTADGSVSDSCFVTVLKEGGDPLGTPAMLFTDIAASWAKENIEKMVEFGVLSGYPDGTFQPKKTVTRAEFVTMAVKTLEKLDRVQQGFGGSQAVFKDTADNWAKGYISAAVAHGFVKGYSDSLFGPNDEITREQMAAMIVQAFELPAAVLQAGFADQDEISSWAREAVAAITESKIMSGTTGKTGNRFAPQDKATREEAATVLCRVLQQGGYL